jgi:hypothetical protein
MSYLNWRFFMLPVSGHLELDTRELHMQVKLHHRPALLHYSNMKGNLCADR